MLAKMGAALQLVPKPIYAENLYDLKELLSARRAEVKDRTAAKARKATATNALIKRQLERRLRQIASDTAEIDALMLTLASLDPHMSERVEILSSIPGIGPGLARDWRDNGDPHSRGYAQDRHLGYQTARQPRRARADVTELLSQCSGKWQGKARIHPSRDIALQYTVGQWVVARICDIRSSCPLWLRSGSIRT